MTNKKSKPKTSSTKKIVKHKTKFTLTDTSTLLAVLTVIIGIVCI